jgi:hypothetical protein
VACLSSIISQPNFLSHSFISKLLHVLQFHIHLVAVPTEVLNSGFTVLSFTPQYLPNIAYENKQIMMRLVCLQQRQADYGEAHAAQCTPPATYSTVHNPLVPEFSFKF